MKTSRRSIYVLSLVLHAVLAGAVTRIKQREARKPIAVIIRNVRAARPAPSELPGQTPAPSRPAPAVLPMPPSHARVPTRQRVRPAAPTPAARSAAPAASPPASAGSVPDFGIALSGGVGPGGIAVPSGSGSNSQQARIVGPRTLSANATDDCSETVVRPRVVSMPQPSYGERARQAGIEGRVRVELSVGADGSVTGARVLQPLGYGLDEAALEAARNARFEPASRCGRRVATTFVVSMRFSL